MVLGAKNRRGPTVHVDCLVHIQEIKPWPPSQSLRSLRSVLIQWENGERSSGSTNTVSPTLGSIVGEGKIEFNESFKLPVNLMRDMSVKGRNADVFQKNILEFNLYEPRREKIQLLATAMVDLAEYGVIKETLDVTVPMNSKRIYSNATQPILFIKIDRIHKGRNSSSARECLPKELSLERKGCESVSSLMDGEYAEEAEVASFTDDDVSSHSSLTVSSSTFESNGSSLPRNEEVEANSSMRSNGCEYLSQKVHEMVATKGITVTRDDQSKEDSSTSSEDQLASSANCPQVDKQDFAYFSDSLLDGEDDRKVQRNGQIASKEVSATVDAYDNSLEGNSGYDWQENGHDLKIDRLKHVKSVRSSSDSVRSNVLCSNNQHTELKEIGVLGDMQNGPGTFRSKSNNERKDAKIYPKDARSAILENKMQQLENKIQMLERELREAAAVEAALYSVVAEHGSSMTKVHAPARRLSRLYLHACKESFQSRSASAARSAVSGLALVAKACGNDVPRLTFWLSNSVVLRAIISESTGDLELQLSAGPMERNGGVNGKKQVSPLKWKEASPVRKESKLTSSGSFSDWDNPFAFISALERVEAWIFSRIIESVWWQTLTPRMQSAARKEINGGTGISSSKSYGRVSSKSDQDQMNFSLDHWKKAFKDACERLCPVRAAGHECGCLHLLSKLIMEQCVARLDVAMFNAILRDSGDEMPTDPVSDPISDPLVLPIPAGKTSFGAGAQLKNAIGNWSRWLTDLFGIDDDDSVGVENYEDNSDKRQDTSLKPFHLLNALSDLLMLPKDMLLSRPIREEVCPTFGATLIKRVLDNFAPDEFCPDPVPDAVLEALEAEDPVEAREGSVTNFPCIASFPVYSPPSATSVASIIGEVGNQSQLRRSGSSVLRKSYTSDDELDELNSPLASIFIDGFQSSPAQSKPNCASNGNVYQNTTIRYELLRDVWMKSE
ncbi:hypothetical protein PTKIN_Ptkin07bG0014600 [Pterospermum kingtungense]